MQVCALRVQRILCIGNVQVCVESFFLGEVYNFSYLGAKGKIKLASLLGIIGKGSEKINII